jgi:hypothetical protein
MYDFHSTPKAPTYLLETPQMFPSQHSPHIYLGLEQKKIIA